MMTKLQYLYGEDANAQSWKQLRYIEALELKNKLANAVLTEILAQRYMCRDEKRLRAVLKAIKFNEERIEE